MPVGIFPFALGSRWVRIRVMLGLCWVPVLMLFTIFHHRIESHWGNSNFANPTPRPRWTILKLVCLHIAPYCFQMMKKVTLLTATFYSKEASYIH